MSQVFVFATAQNNKRTKQISKWYVYLDPKSFEITNFTFTKSQIKNYRLI